jgi:osmotically-inducible protein OsmY
MKLGYIFFYGLAVIGSAVGIGACDSTTGVVNTNANVSNVRANSNTAVLVNSNGNTGVVSRTANSNVTREEYDKNRAEYEKDRGDSKIGTGANDGWIWFKTKTALATADDLRDSTINVDVENEKITLRGTVATAAQKAQAQKVAEGIEGQKGVTNRLTVSANDSITNTGGSGNGNNSNSNRNR